MVLGLLQQMEAERLQGAYEGTGSRPMGIHKVGLQFSESLGMNFDLSRIDSPEYLLIQEGAIIFLTQA